MLYCSVMVRHAITLTWSPSKQDPFGIFRSSAVTFDLMSSMSRNMPLEAHFQSMEQRQATRSEIRRVRCLGDDTTSEGWLGALFWTRSHCPCLPATFVAPLPPNCIAQPVQNLYVKIVSFYYSYYSSVLCLVQRDKVTFPLPQNLLLVILILEIMC
jgi:hypothetical protein